MRPLIWLLGAAFTFVSAAPAASIVITSDKGGQIGAYVARFSKVRRSGERVIIDGVCLSACTIVVGMIPHERLCATRNAVLGFHAAWFPDDDGRMIPSREATQVLMTFYPPNLRQWIARRGGLTPKLMLLQGRELAAIVPPCDATIAAERNQRAAQDKSNRRAATATTAPPSAEAAMPR